tara:strand:+ start:772 stop:1110 length:339 start_codon:yes stop_codon:yes gene_type:complete
VTKSFDLCLFERSNCYNHFVRGWSLVPVAPFIPIGKGARLDMQTSAEQDHIANSTAYQQFLWSRDRNPARLLQFNVDRTPHCSSRRSMCTGDDVPRRAALCDPKWAGWAGRG